MTMTQLTFKLPNTWCHDVMPPACLWGHFTIVNKYWNYDKIRRMIPDTLVAYCSAPTMTPHYSSVHFTYKKWHIRENYNLSIYQLTYSRSNPMRCMSVHCVHTIHRYFYFSHHKYSHRNLPLLLVPNNCLEYTPSQKSAKSVSFMFSTKMFLGWLANWLPAKII